MRPTSPIVRTILHAAVAISISLMAGEFLAQSSDEPASEQRRKDATFVNPIAEGADPWVIRDPRSQRYLWCMSEGNRAIAIHSSPSVTSLGRKSIVWHAPDEGPWSREVWAPELHYLDEHWYIYFAASDGQNQNHLAYVLKSADDDPLGEYHLHGPFATGEGPNGLSPNLWAIDMTVMQHRGKRYALWSGWDRPDSDQQFLYIAQMKSPTELATPRVRLCENDTHLWERVEPSLNHRGLNEAPQIFQSDSRTVVVYSCGASWLSTYKLGMLELVGDNPLDPAAWRKQKQPVFQGTTSVVGVGHSCWVPSLDDRQWWHVFHAKRDTAPGWRRAIFVQPLNIDPQGYPVFGVPLPPRTRMDRPSGDLMHDAEFSVREFDYFGHHQLLTEADETLRIGQMPEAPVNLYRSGEKVLFSGRVSRDFVAEVTLDFHGERNARDGGLLFRAMEPSIGYDAQKAYFAGLIPGTQLVILGKTDGIHWQELARSKTQIDPDQPQHLRLKVQGNQFVIFHNGKKTIEHSDSTYTQGHLGLRVVDTDASFSNIVITPLAPR